MCVACLFCGGFRQPELMRASRRARAWRALCRGVEASGTGVAIGLGPGGVIAVFVGHLLSGLLAEFVTRM